MNTIPRRTLDIANAAIVVGNTPGWPAPRFLWMVDAILLKKGINSASMELKTGGMLEPPHVSVAWETTVLSYVSTRDFDLSGSLSYLMMNKDIAWLSRPAKVTSCLVDGKMSRPRETVGY
jgi:hypothetical protein